VVSSLAEDTFLGVRLSALTAIGEVRHELRQNPFSFAGARARALPAPKSETLDMYTCARKEQFDSSRINGSSTAAARVTQRLSRGRYAPCPALEFLGTPSCPANEPRALNFVGHACCVQGCSSDCVPAARLLLGRCLDTAPKVVKRKRTRTVRYFFEDFGFGVAPRGLFVLEERVRPKKCLAASNMYGHAKKK